MWVPSDQPFIASKLGDSSQGAMTESRNPFSYFAIAAVPFGTTPPSEAVPIAEHGIAKDYLAALRKGRAQYELEFRPNGPVATLFSQKATGQVSLLQLTLTSVDGSTKPTLYVEWVVEAGPRIWIVRIVKQLPDGTKDLTSQAAFLQSLESLTISSNNLDNPSTLKPAFGTGTIPGMPNTGITSAAGGGTPDLPALLVMLAGGLIALSGVALRRRERVEL